jgi:hypothetical protein
MKSAIYYVTLLAIFLSYGLILPAHAGGGGTPEVDPGILTMLGLGISGAIVSGRKYFNRNK